MKKNLVTIERLRQRLAYDKSTGVFTWLHCDGVHKDFNKNLAGKQAGSVDREGYTRINLDSEAYYAHRLAWYFVTGEYPDRSVDHIDGDRSNNALVNLRLATPLQNSQNQAFETRTGNSRVRGAYFRKAEGKWSSKIRHNKKYIWLGYFDDEASAAAAYEAKAAELRGEFYRAVGAC